MDKREKAFREIELSPERFWSKVMMIPFHDCWEWIGAKSSFGYGKIGFSFNNKKVHIDSHRLSWRLHSGPIPNGMLVCHKCDNPGCVRPDHLFLGTYSDNLKDMDNKGRRVCNPPRILGEKHGISKLKNKDVLTIKKLLKEKAFTQTEIAKRFHVSGAAINCIAVGKTWGWLKD